MAKKNMGWHNIEKCSIIIQQLAGWRMITIKINIRHTW
jgi:hypothetical protein